MESNASGRASAYAQSEKESTFRRTQKVEGTLKTSSDIQSPKLPHFLGIAEETS